MKAGGTGKEKQGGTNYVGSSGVPDATGELLQAPEEEHLRGEMRSSTTGKEVEPESLRDTTPALREPPKSCNKNRTTSCSPCHDHERSCMLC